MSRYELKKWTIEIFFTRIFSHLLIDKSYKNLLETCCINWKLFNLTNRFCFIQCLKNTWKFHYMSRHLWEDKETLEKYVYTKEHLIGSWVLSHHSIRQNGLDNFVEVSFQSSILDHLDRYCVICISLFELRKEPTVWSVPSIKMPNLSPISSASCM